MTEFQTPSAVLATMTVNGREYKLRVTMWGIMKLEELTGEEMGGGGLVRYMERAQTSITAAMHILWMLMLADDPTLTMDYVAQNTSIPDLMSFYRVAMDIAVASLPEPEPPVNPNSALGKDSPPERQNGNPALRRANLHQVQ